MRIWLWLELGLGFRARDRIIRFQVTIKVRFRVRRRTKHKSTETAPFTRVLAQSHRNRDSLERKHSLPAHISVLQGINVNKTGENKRA